MLTIRIDLTDGMQRELEARVRDGAHDSIEDYVRELIASDLSDDDDSWEMTPELAALLKEGQDSGTDPRSVSEIFAEARKRWNA
jgi:Arc/MetJ-type ribon-helix-helix transcriptional regulator